MFSRILRDLREAAQEKQSDVAKAVFVSPSAISQYEHGRTVLSRSTLEALAKHFNVTTDYLLGVSPNPDLEETMNQIYCDNITISSLLDRYLNIPHAKRHHIVAVIDEFQPIDSKIKSKGFRKMILMAVGPVDRDDFLSWLYEQYSDFIYKLAWDLCSEPQDIDDLVQTVWEKLISKEQVLQTLDKPQQLNYISKTLKNTLREDARRKKLLACSLDSVVECSSDPIDLIDDAIDQAIQLRVFREVWPQIDEDIRELLERKYDLNETDEEIAQSMGIKPASVRMYLSRARKQARKILNEHKHLLLR